MIRELLYELYTDHRYVAGSGAVLILYLASVLTIVLTGSGKKDRILPAVMSVPVSIGYALSVFIDTVTEGRKKKPALFYATCIFAGVICLMAVAASGTAVFSKDIAQIAENDMHIPYGLTETMDAILDESDDPKVLTMPGWGPYFESYSSAFSMMYEEPEKGDISGMNEDESCVYTELSKVHPDMRKVVLAARRNGCTYVVLSDGIWPDIPITQCGYELVREGGGSLLYREVKTP